MTEDIGEFNPKKRLFIGFVPTAEMLEQIKQIAKAEDRGVSGQIRIMIKEWLEARESCQKL